jgi:hypothetical protein
MMLGGMALGLLCSFRPVSACSCVPDDFDVMIYDSAAGTAEIRYCSSLFYSQGCDIDSVPQFCRDLCSTFTYYESDFIDDIVAQIDTNGAAFVAHIDSVAYDTLVERGQSLGRLSTTTAYATVDTVLKGNVGPLSFAMVNFLYPGSCAASLGSLHSDHQQLRNSLHFRSAW